MCSKCLSSVSGGVAQSVSEKTLSSLWKIASLSAQKEQDFFRGCGKPDCNRCIASTFTVQLSCSMDNMDFSIRNESLLCHYCIVMTG